MGIISSEHPFKLIVEAPNVPPHTIGFPSIQKMSVWVQQNHTKEISIHESFKTFSSPVRLVLDVDDTNAESLYEDLKLLKIILQDFADSRAKEFKWSGVIPRNDTSSSAHIYTNIALPRESIFFLL